MEGNTTEFSFDCLTKDPLSLSLARAGRGAVSRSLAHPSSIHAKQDTHNLLDLSNCSYPER